MLILQTYTDRPRHSGQSGRQSLPELDIPARLGTPTALPNRCTYAYRLLTASSRNRFCRKQLARRYRGVQESTST